MKQIALVICLALAGCADGYRPAATSDDALAAQYKSRTPHGVMTGAEGQAIADAYRKSIAAQPAPPPDMGSGPGTGSNQP